jgi:pullulanase/glycogen debranching enzyme
LLGIDGINFAVLSTARNVTLCIFLAAEDYPIEIPMRCTHAGHEIPIWHLFIQGLPNFTLYGYRVNHGDHINVDPYCKLIHSSGIWGNSLPKYAFFIFFITNVEYFYYIFYTIFILFYLICDL